MWTRPIRCHSANKLRSAQPQCRCAGTLNPEPLNIQSGLRTAAPPRGDATGDSAPSARTGTAGGESGPGA